MSEVWKDIVNYEGFYQVSNLGRVRSLDRYDNRGIFHESQIIKPKQHPCGYYGIGLWKEGKQSQFLIHRLVAQAFIPNENDLPDINHRNEDKTDNRVANLEWCDHIYNMRFGTRGERCRKKADCHAVVQMDMEGNVIAEFEAIKVAARVVGINNAETITKCCKGARPSAGGYKWKYKTVK